MKKERIKDLLNLEEDNLRLNEAPKSSAGSKFGTKVKNAAKNINKSTKAAIKQRQASNPNLNSKNPPTNTKSGTGSEDKDKTKSTEDSITVDNDILGTEEETSNATEVTAQKLLISAWNEAGDKTQQDNLKKAIQTILEAMSKYSAKGEPSNE